MFQSNLNNINRLTPNSGSDVPLALRLRRAPATGQAGALASTTHCVWRIHQPRHVNTLHRPPQIRQCRRDRCSRARAQSLRCCPHLSTNVTVPIIPTPGFRYCKLAACDSSRPRHGGVHGGQGRLVTRPWFSPTSSLKRGHGSHRQVNTPPRFQ